VGPCVAAATEKMEMKPGDTSSPFATTAKDHLACFVNGLPEFPRFMGRPVRVRRREESQAPVRTYAQLAFSAERPSWADRSPGVRAT